MRFPYHNKILSSLISKKLVIPSEARILVLNFGTKYASSHPHDFLQHSRIDISPADDRHVDRSYWQFVLMKQKSGNRNRAAGFSQGLRICCQPDS